MVDGVSNVAGHQEASGQRHLPFTPAAKPSGALKLEMTLIKVQALGYISSENSL
jgi:hypothetical protein